MNFLLFCLILRHFSRANGLILAMRDGVVDGNRVLLSDCFSVVPFIRNNNGAIKELVYPGDGGSTALPNGPLWPGKA